MIPINKINIATSAPLLKYYYWVKSCYTGPFATTQNPFLNSKSSDLIFFLKMVLKFTLLSISKFIPP
jgi:hypothetical protein